MRFKRPRFVAITLVVALVIALQLSAQDNPGLNPKLNPLGGGDDTSKVIVYSDSLADNGNIYKLFGFPGPPYWNGRFSNGPVAVEDLAPILEKPLLDYAYAAATTGLGDLIDGGTVEQLGSQRVPGITTAYNTTIDSIAHDTIIHSLFVVYGGFNDFFIGGLTTAIADRAVANLVSIVTDLQKRGAQRILVPGLFDMGMTPYYRSQGPSIAARATYLSSYMNQKLVASLPKDALYFDTYTLYHQMAANPEAFGLTNVVDQCYNNGLVCSNAQQYLFWDFVHPTAHVHSLVAVEYVLTLATFDQHRVEAQDVEQR
jgi:cholinesterase